MITFHIITIFPKIFDSFLKESFIKKAQEKKLIKIKIYNLRDFTKNKHKSVDDRPYGGGLGMVLKLEPIYRVVKSINIKGKEQKTKVILFTPRGKQFTQKMAYSFSKLKHLILICGRYEGVDERVAKYIADLELSIGPYDLMGGELPAMVVIEAVTRLISGVIGKPEFLKERMVKGGFIEYPQYTRPEVFSPKKGVYWKVPKVLLSGNHKKIREWRKKHQKVIEG
jgi:tRNA (guanine37-N1)-methyltransferase